MAIAIRHPHYDLGLCISRRHGSKRRALRRDVVYLLALYRQWTRQSIGQRTEPGGYLLVGRQPVVSVGHWIRDVVHGGIGDSGVL